MIIVSPKGLFNTDRITRIESYEGSTYAHDGAQLHLISDKPVVADILQAMMRHDEFIEVE